MPSVVTDIAVFTPLYHLVKICRAFSAGTFTGAVWSMAWIIVVVSLLAPFPFRLMRKRIIP
jgi:lipooligosaccharide transport system permease protein